MDQQHSQVDIPPFTDATETADGTTGELSGSQSEIAGKVSSGGKAVDVADEGDQGGGGEPTDAGYGQQTLDCRALTSQGTDLVLEQTDSLFEVSDLVSRIV